MSVKKFKVGDKAKVRKGLVANKYYDDVRCADSMARMGERVLTIDCVESDYYRVQESMFCWSDEMLETAEKTLDNLCAGDFIRRGDGLVRKVLAAVDGCYMLARGEECAAAGSWYTAAELDKLGYHPIKLDAPELTIEIDGKKYNKTEVEEAVKDLKVVD